MKAQFGPFYYWYLLVLSCSRDLTAPGGSLHASALLWKNLAVSSGGQVSHLWKATLKTCTVYIHVKDFKGMSTFHGGSGWEYKWDVAHLASIIAEPMHNSPSSSFKKHGFSESPSNRQSSRFHLRNRMVLLWYFFNYHLVIKHGYWSWQFIIGKSSISGYNGWFLISMLHCLFTIYRWWATFLLEMLKQL